MRVCNSTLTKILLPIAATFILFLSISSFFGASNTLVNAQDANETRPSVDLEFGILRQRTVPGNFYRAKVPGGWIVAVTPLSGQQSVAMVFIPDADHTWDGKSLK
jgi:hypothetical protein